MRDRNQKMKVAIKALTQTNKDEMEQVQLKYLSRQDELVKIINMLKKKLNSLNKEVDSELQI